jgi:hypothetical protein
MNLASFINLQDAQIRANETQATIADKLADIPGKLAQADLTEAQPVNQHLKNVALFLNIGWDRQAHYQLERAKTIALQMARVLRNRRQLFADRTRDAGWLLAGEGSATAITAGWIGFEFLRPTLPFLAAMKAGTVPLPAEAFDRSAWLHPEHDVPRLPGMHDGGTLLGWARTSNLYPVLGGPAWTYIAGILQSLADAAATEAAELDKQTAAAEASALELEKIDWSRVQKPAGV